MLTRALVQRGAPVLTSAFNLLLHTPYLTSARVGGRGRGSPVPSPISSPARQYPMTSARRAPQDSAAAAALGAVLAEGRNGSAKPAAGAALKPDSDPQAAAPRSAAAYSTAAPASAEKERTPGEHRGVGGSPVPDSSAAAAAGTTSDPAQADGTKPKRKRAAKKVKAAVKTADGAEEGTGPGSQEEGAPPKPAKKPRAKKVEWPPGPLYEPETMRPPRCEAAALHVISWNVAGLRALTNKDPGALARLAAAEAPDVICLQETKLQDAHVAASEAATGLAGWHHHWHCSTTVKGYSGTAIITRKAAVSVVAGLGTECSDLEGRVLTADFGTHYIVNVYTPNSGDGLKRLNYRIDKWDAAFARHVGRLREEKPTILCGDLNCAHKEIDIANPKGNLRSAGFTVEERQSFTDLYAESGWVDIFRRQHPEPCVAYTYYGYRFNMRAKGKGWRLDYFLVPEAIADHVHDAYHLKHFLGSDHVPLGLVLRELPGGGGLSGGDAAAALDVAPPP